MKGIINIIAIATMVAIGSVGTARAQATLASDTIALGDQTTVSGQFDRLWGDAIVVLDQRYDSTTREQQAVVTSFEPGDHWIHYSPADSLPLTVTDVEVDTTTAEIRDIAPIVLVPHTFWEIFRWVLLALTVAALGAGAWWLWKKWKSGRVTEWLSNEKPDTRTPAERALDALEALRRRQLWQAGNVKEYHTELTDILRRFIEETTAIRATEMTSEDCVIALLRYCASTDAITQSHINTIKEVFATADLVKFAKSEPLPHEHDRSMSQAVDFVKALWEQTKPQEAGEEVQHD